MEVGELLQKERMIRGISLRDIEDATKVRKWYLEALEEGNYGRIPGEFYVQGFLRIYARYLGLNPIHVMELYKAG